MLIGGGEPGECLDELQLCIGACVGRAGQFPQGVSSGGGAGGAVSLGGVATGHGLQLAEQGAHHRGGLLAVDVGQHQLLEATAGQLPVAHHVPGGRPQQGAGQGVVQVAQVLHGDLEGAIVQAHLGEGEVAVVQQPQVSALAGQLRHFGEGPVHVQLHLVGAHQGAALEAEPAHLQAVRAQGGVLGRRLLGDREAGDGAVGVMLQHRAQGVHARGLQPQP